MFSRRIDKRLAAAVAAAAGIALLVGTADRAGAAYPGTNGKIAFVTNRDSLFALEIYVMNTDGSGQTNLTQNPAVDSEPDWSPDGSRIAFMSTRDGNPELYVMNADGTQQTRLTHDAAGDREPAWSPDGTKIAFRTDRDLQFTDEIYVMNADGSGQTRLTNNASYEDEPAWSPDGSRLAFRSLRNGNWDLYVVNADGTGETRLTEDPAADTSPRWSPDGTKIVFTRVVDGNFDFDVFVMNADGTGETHLAANAAGDSFPDWSPDGSKIVFNSGRDGNPEIYSMNADGSGLTRLTTHSDLDLMPAWQTVPSADLALSIAATPDTVKSGKPLTYVVSVLNAGPSNAHGVVVTDTLPEGARFVSAQPSKGTCVTPAPGATGTLTCSLGFLPAATNATTQIVVKVVVRRTTVANTAGVSSATPDPNPANNTATIATVVR